MTVSHTQYDRNFVKFPVIHKFLKQKKMPSKLMLETFLGEF